MTRVGRWWSRKHTYIYIFMIILTWILLKIIMYCE